VGEHGTALWDGQGVPVAETVTAGGTFFSTVQRTAAVVEEWPYTGIAASLRDFLHALETGGTPMGECHDNIKSLAMVFAAIESAAMFRRRRNMAGFSMGRATVRPRCSLHQRLRELVLTLMHPLAVLLQADERAPEPIAAHHRCLGHCGGIRVADRERIESPGDLRLPAAAQIQPAIYAAGRGQLAELLTPRWNGPERVRVVLVALT
jgi:hypothetical protein